MLPRGQSHRWTGTWAPRWKGTQRLPWCRRQTLHCYPVFTAMTWSRLVLKWKTSCVRRWCTAGVCKLPSWKVPSFLISSLPVRLSQVTLMNYFCIHVPCISNLIASNNVKSHELGKICTDCCYMHTCFLNINFSLNLKATSVFLFCFVLFFGQ